MVALTAKGRFPTESLSQSANAEMSSGQLAWQFSPGPCVLITFSDFFHIQMENIYTELQETY